MLWHELRKVLTPIRLVAVILILTLSFVIASFIGGTSEARSMSATSEQVQSAIESFQQLHTQIATFNQDAEIVKRLQGAYTAFLSTYTPFADALASELPPLFGPMRDSYSAFFELTRNYIFSNPWIWFYGEDADIFHDFTSRIHSLLVGQTDTTAPALNTLRGVLNPLIDPSNQNLRIDNILTRAQTLTLTPSQIGELTEFGSHLNDWYNELAHEGFTEDQVRHRQQSFLKNSHIYLHFRLDKLLVENHGEQVGESSLSRGEASRLRFLLENLYVDSDLGGAFRFRTPSSTYVGTTAFDFIYSGLEIAFPIVVALVLAFVFLSVHFDLKKGTVIGTLLTRNSRTGVIGAKFLSAVMLGTLALLLLVAMFAVSAVGFAGGGALPVLYVFNNGIVAVVHPFVMLMIYLLSLWVWLVLFVAIAMLVGLLVKNSQIALTLSIAIPLVLYLLNILINPLRFYEVIFLGLPLIVTSLVLLGLVFRNFRRRDF